ncbi:MAG: redoxin domain-containing protein [Planctomycetales bacterium]|nr:redoxin domain-containing protein [Planctomycetales bacterium]
MILARWLSLALLLAFVAECGAEVGQKIDDFELRDFRGKTWSLRESGDRTIVLAFLGTECPLVQFYAKRLEELQAEYAERGVVVVGIDSNLQDSLAELASFARRHDLTYPLLKDPGNRVADQLGAERTPEVFLLDRQRHVRYRGRIDDQYTYGIARTKPTQRYLRDAIEALLGNRPVALAETETVGCHIGRVLTPQTDSDVTYSNQIARIFQQRCVECHRPGEIAPFPLTTYEETLGWAEMIDEVTSERRMPPWHAEPGHQQYANDAHLSDEELRTIRKWVAAGAPEGDPKELPQPVQFTEGWRIGEPDRIVWMSEKSFSVPAEGEVKYQYFTVDPKFETDMWVQAAECRPGNRAVVHHIIVGIKSPNEDQDGVHGVRSEWLAATAPGAQPMILPSGQAKLIPARSKLVFQMHYTPNGTKQTDRSSIGLRFIEASAVKHRVATHKAINTRFRIPPHAANHKETTRPYTFGSAGYLVSMFPHMHLRGKSFTYVAHFPDGRPDQTLLHVPRYDFNWQNGYLLKEPMLMPKGTQIVCDAVFDNSEDNLANPDPKQTVSWGDQTDEEMMIGYFDIYDAEDASRTQEFIGRLDQLQRKSLADAARGSLHAERQFTRFAQQLRLAMPQVDRVDWTVHEQRKLKVLLVAQDASTRRTLLGQLVTSDAEMALPTVASQTEPVVHANLASVPGKDFAHMRRLMASSAHFPIELDGKRGVISFWSTERNAFPDSAVKLLQELAPIMATP